jgi:hypothetical protein
MSSKSEQDEACHVATEPGQVPAPAILANLDIPGSPGSQARAYRRIADASSGPALFTPRAKRRLESITALHGKKLQSNMYVKMKQVDRSKAN